MADTIKAKITTLSPVHVGSGKGELVNDYDFIFNNGFYYIIDHEKMFEQIKEELLQSNNIDVRISKILKTIEQVKKCKKYHICYMEKDITKICEHIKDAQSRPYIPGSSIKGAIRTALAYAMIEGGVTNLNIDDMLVRRNNKLVPNEADDKTEKRLFGESPESGGNDANYDIMRALHVSDTNGLNKGIALGKVNVHSIRDNKLEPKKLITYREIIPKGKVLEFSIKLDNKMLNDDMFKKLNFNNLRGKEYLEKYPECCNSFAEKILDNEVKFYSKYDPNAHNDLSEELKKFYKEVKIFYDDLKNQFDKLDKQRQFFLQMSWGTGWRAKTVGMAMDDIFDDVVDKFKLGKGRKYDEFPKTRRLIERGNIPEMPLGWVIVELT